VGTLTLMLIRLTEFAHNSDIKPENLLFTRIPLIPSQHPVRRQYDEDKTDEGEFQPGIGGGEIGQVKIADFGLSKIVWNEETQTPCGTVGYTAPEIVKDERYSKNVDMWALGCVLYTLLCGFPPFYDESINVLTEKVARGHYTFLRPWWDDISLSGGFSRSGRIVVRLLICLFRLIAQDLIKHLLCVNPEERYTIDEFLAHEWCQVCQISHLVISQITNLINITRRPHSSLPPPHPSLNHMSTNHSTPHFYNPFVARVVSKLVLPV
jgi:serine/threonine protein kinase